MTNCKHLVTKAVYQDKKLVGYSCVACATLVPVNPQYQKGLKQKMAHERHGACDKCGNPGPVTVRQGWGQWLKVHLCRICRKDLTIWR